MKKRFLGIICFLYSGVILYVWLFDKLKNFLAPQMQIYIRLAFIPMLIMGLVLCFNNNINYKFKISDLVLILPILLLIFAGDGRLTMSFANNRITQFNTTQDEEENSENFVEETDNEFIEKEKYDFSNPDFEIIDENYYELANYITFLIDSSEYEGKTIKVRGFTSKMEQYVPSNYFGIGKYGISCCAADAGFVGFIVKYDNHKVKNNTWYEIEGVLEKAKDKANYDILAIKIINIKEINSKDEEQYVYSCYAYGDGSCKEVTKYNLQY